MVVLKTKNTHSVLKDRSFVDTTVYLKIQEICLGADGANITGYYFIKPDDNERVLDFINMDPINWETVEAIEANLNAFDANSLRAAINQRAVEFAFAVLQQEGDEKNYNIPANDWEVEETEATV